ncbi:F-box domain-containing protein [Rutstroemia sp. NJR-2017a BBW]|nr:F-box domain-containing protein [Rutstroemia sp. NJR-2017a BBW]
MTSQSSLSDPHLDDNTSQFDDQSSTYPRTSAATQPSDCQTIAESGAACGMATPTSSSGKADKAGIDARTKISNLLKDKAREWTAVVEKRNGPLRLLDLPMDVLKEIVKEVTHTNDLTSLALTHSALHNLAIPHIYSRFDIVWPDAHATSDPRTGVDALTYGLATLCMGDALSSAGQSQSFTCKHCGTPNEVDCDHPASADARSTTRRLGNSYPQFTRKFSLGNGPTDWVQEYLITKESGKMLGTLVALAVAKMINLESFSWDMPTGVLRDVWLALSSLQDKSPNQECRLERVWVRWHDNSEAIHLSSSQSSTVPGTTTQQMLAGTSMSSIGWILTPDLGSRSPNLSQPLVYSQSRVEYPTLSVLPPLKSLSVLDIDEVEYLDEMSVLIERSKDKLRELRIGIAAKAIHRDFALPWDGAELQQVDHEAKWPGASRIGEKRLGGVLGIILGRIFDIRKKPRGKTEKKARSSTPSMSLPPSTSTPNASSTIQNPASEIAENGLYNWDYKESADAIVPGVAFNVEAGSTLGNGANHEQLVSSTLHAPHSDMDSLTALIAAHQFTSDNEAAAQNVAQTEIPSDIPAEPPLRRSQSSSGRQAHFTEMSSSIRERLDGKLRLQTLELERVPLSVAVLQRAFDWSVLTNLTILDCPQHEKFWSMLRRHFAPTPIGNHLSSKHNGQAQYHLNLRKVHTDAASPALISFLKETLAPNTLETLFLQDRKRGPNSTVTIDAIYRGPLKRHRSSLKKLLLDSSDRIPRGPTSSVDSTKWKAWMPNRDVLNFITSGRMSSLRELSIAIDYKDWHHFLQRLPQIPHLRSLNVPYIADHVTSNFDPRELALQIVDVIVLRPEVELCYMGVSHKEILFYDDKIAIFKARHGRL